MPVPRDSSGIGVSGCPSTAASRLTILPPSPGPSTTTQRSTRGHCVSACSATSRLAVEVIRIFASLLSAMARSTGPGVAARSCLTLAVQAEGAEIRTVEGLAPADRLSVLQEAFRDHYGLQCGFCTPGILMSLDALLRDRPDAGEAEIREFLSGHLCRCTGYGSIVRAAMAAARKLREEPENA